MSEKTEVAHAEYVKIKLEHNFPLSARQRRWLLEQIERVQKLEDIRVKDIGFVREIKNKEKLYREALENSQVAIQKNLAKKYFKDENILYEAYKQNVKALEGESDK